MPYLNSQNRDVDIEGNVYYSALHTTEIDLINLYDPQINVYIASWYLHRLHDHYKCDIIEKILMAYNAGITRCKKVNFDLKKLPYETRKYVPKVLSIYNK